MKTAFLFLLLCFGFSTGHIARAQETKTNAPPRVPAADAKDHVGKEAIVFGKVIEVYRTDRLVRMNLEKPFPNQPFTAVVFASKTNLFPDLEKLKGQGVEISGKITEYRDQPQIVLVATNQLRLVEGKAADVPKKSP